MSFYNGLFPMASRPNGDQLSAELVTAGITGAVVVWDSGQVCVALYSDIATLNSGQVTTVETTLAAHTPTSQSTVIPLQWVGIPASFPTGFVYTTGVTTGVSVLLAESSPAALTASVNDYAPGVATLMRLTTNGGGPYNITGLAGGFAGLQSTIYNIHASDQINLTHQDVASQAINRFICPGGLTQSIPAGTNARITYDNTTQRWRVG